MYRMTEYGKQCLIKQAEDELNVYHHNTQNANISLCDGWFEEYDVFKTSDWNDLETTAIPVEYYYVDMLCKLEDKQYIAQYDGNQWHDCFDNKVSVPEKVKLVNQFDRNKKLVNKSDYKFSCTNGYDHPQYIPSDTGSFTPSLGNGYCYR